MINEAWLDQFSAHLCLQLVHSAYQTVLGHLRSRTLYCFKEALDKALNNGEGFAFASHACCQHFMTAFDEGCAGRLNWLFLTLIIMVQFSTYDLLSSPIEKS